MAEREDANPLSDLYPQSSNSKRQHDPRARTRFQGLLSPFGRILSQKSDPELGACGVSASPSALRSNPKLAAFLDSDGDSMAFLDSDGNSMVYRRFGWLHSRVFLYKQDELARLERVLLEQDEIDRLERRPDKLDENSRQREESTSHKSRDWLSKAVMDKLSDYDSLISRMRPSAHTSRQSACRYHSVREYLNHGPPIYMDYSKIRFNQWADYERAVDELLKDPETAHWLDGPLDQDWSETIIQQKQQLDHDWRSVDDLSGRYKIKRTLDHMAGTLFWISHITSALGFVLIYNASGPEGHPLLEFLLAYWYFSAVSIVVQGFYAKGFVYARKVFLGGLLACPAGFYVLNILLNTPRAASFTAMPTIFTVVLLLIRTI